MTPSVEPPSALPGASGGVSADAPWRERYCHITDPDGHEIGFARPVG